MQNKQPTTKPSDASSESKKGAFQQDAQREERFKGEGKSSR